MRQLATLRIVRGPGEIFERQYMVRHYFRVWLLFSGAQLLRELLSNIVICNWSASLLRGRLNMPAIEGRRGKHAEKADVWQRRVHWR